MYHTLKKIYDENHPATWNMAVAHLMDCGYRSACEWADEDIDTQKENGMMTKEFVQHLFRLAREIARNSTPTELIQFCMVEKCISTQGYKRRIKEDDYEKGR